MEIGRHRGVIANAHIKIGSNSYEKVETFKHLGSLLTNQNSIQEEIKCRLKAGRINLPLFSTVVPAVTFVFLSRQLLQVFTKLSSFAQFAWY